MKCRNCGADIGDFAAFCTYCGKPTGSQPSESSQLAQSAHDEQRRSDEPLPGYAEPFAQDGREAPPPLHAYAHGDLRPEISSISELDRTQTSFVPDYEEDRMNGTSWAEINRIGYITGENGRYCGIGWFRFIAYFLQFAMAGLAVISSMSFLCGYRYSGVAASWIYAVFPGVLGADIFMGVFQLVFAAGMVFARFRLTGLRRRAVWLYIGVLLAEFVGELIYITVFCGVTGLPMEYSMSFLDGFFMISSLALAVVNFVYFKHRGNVFVH